MDLLFHAQQRLEAYRRELEVAEKHLLSRLEQNAFQSEIKRIEEDIGKIKNGIADAECVIEYYVKKGEMSAQQGVFRLLYHSHRNVDLLPLSGAAVTATTATGVNEEGTSTPPTSSLMSLVLKWSDSNQWKGVCGLIVATPSALFGMMEGPKETVEALFNKIQKDPRHMSCTRLFSQFVERREYTCGLKLYEVNDDIMQAVMKKAQDNVVLGSRYAPSPSFMLAASGGDPLGVAPELLTGVIVMCVAVDVLCGGNSTPEVYQTVTLSVRRVLKKYQIGEIVELFGEHMTIIFPKLTPSTSVVLAAKELYDEVPNLVIAIHSGEVMSVSSPFCVAFGEGLRSCRRLMVLAEECRRPFVLSQDIYDRCSKAEVQFVSFTIEGVVFHTLLSVNETRLETAPQPEADDDLPTGHTVQADSEKPNVVRHRPMSNDELQKKREDAAVVKGAWTEAVLRQRFRDLDPGDAGWIAKDKFKLMLPKWLAAFPMLPHEEKQLDRWLSQCCSLGPTRLNFTEFSMLSFRLQQQ